MYNARKTFNTLKEAREEIFLSSSLEQSDLPDFLTEGINDFKDLKNRIKTVKNDPEVDDADVNYPVLKGNYFKYVTLSGINSITIEEREENGQLKFYCQYEVVSEKPLLYSRIVNTFKEAGWEISSNLSEEEERSLLQEYEQDLIELTREFNKIPDINFWVDAENHQGVTYINGHCIRKDDFAIKTLLKNHPELGPEVKKIAREQIKKLEEIKCPTTYDFNEEIRENSSFYIDAKEEVLSILRELVK